MTKDISSKVVPREPIESVEKGNAMPNSHKAAPAPAQPAVPADVDDASNVAAMVKRLTKFPQRRELERACDEAERPVGMSTPSGKAVVQASHLRYLLAAVDHAGTLIEQLAREQARTRKRK